MHLWLYEITNHIFSHYTLQALSSYKSQMSSYNVGDNQLIILSWPHQYFVLLIILIQVEYLSNISVQHPHHKLNMVITLVMTMTRNHWALWWSGILWHILWTLIKGLWYYVYNLTCIQTNNYTELCYLLITFHKD